jgi:threonyl-tRNA synthetase
MADSISISLPDGSARELPAGSTAMDLAAGIGKRLAKAAVAAVVDGREVDLAASPRTATPAATSFATPPPT